MQPLTQQIRFGASADGTRIAYATAGTGAPLVKVSNWLSHLEFDWQSPVWSHLLRELSAGHMLVRYDERGCGLSDWDAELSFDAWVRDLETVVDACGLARFPLLGTSQGASIAIAYAVRHPERVSHLILHGGYARGRLFWERSPFSQEEAEVMIRLAELGWGQDNPAFRQFFTTQFIPGGSPEQHQWFNELERISTSPRERRALHARVQRDRRRRAAAAGRLPDARLARHSRRARSVRGRPADCDPHSRRALRAARNAEPPDARRRAGMATLGRGIARVPAGGGPCAALRRAHAAASAS